MTIDLKKGAKIELKKQDGTQLTKIFMGLGWDPAEGRSSIDLDASCVMFEGQTVKDTIWYRQLESRDRSVRHTGDNLTGHGDGDDEVINVDLTKVPANITSLVFTINSFTGQNFNQVKNCFARLVDSTTKVEFCRFNLAEKGSHTASVMVKVYRYQGAWKIAALGLPASGKTVEAVMRDIIPHL